MNFTIITPSFNQLNYLKGCVASVKDQVSATGCDAAASDSFSVHHHIQDAQSSDGTTEWFRDYIAKQPSITNYQLTFASEADGGMYDAINKGIEHCGLLVNGTGKIKRGQKGEQGEASSDFSSPIRDCSVVAWLNCDEQYLVGTLRKVAGSFLEHPSVDVFFGGMLIVDAESKLLAYRKAMPMRRLFLEASYLYNYSCSMFFRKSTWIELGGLNASFKNAGDEDLLLRALRRGVNCQIIDNYLSSFTYTEKNLSSDPSAVLEHEVLKCALPAGKRWLRVPLNLMRLGEKMFRGGYRQVGAISYDLFRDGLEDRTHCECESPSLFWPGKKLPYLLRHRLR
jgi:glycosyltransferase involved in cell wall biosynthesis